MNPKHCSDQNIATAYCIFWSTYLSNVYCISHSQPRSRNPTWFVQTTSENHLKHKVFNRRSETICFTIPNWCFLIKITFFWSFGVCIYIHILTPSSQMHLERFLSMSPANARKRYPVKLKCIIFDKNACNFDHPSNRFLHFFSPGQIIDFLRSKWIREKRREVYSKFTNKYKKHINDFYFISKF